MRALGVALLGYGNVGSGSHRILREHGEDIARRLGARPVVRRVLVRDVSREREGLDAAQRTDDFDAVLADPAVAVVVELMGGIEPARSYIRRALESGRHVVTANKALLALHGEELFELAHERGVDLQFEGAVCGGIPIIRTLREALASDRVTALTGIVNGTTNFLLDAMGRGQPYAEALAEAQRLGLAEADPTMDVSGMDAVQKLCLLARVSFGARLRPDQVPVEGIDALDPGDLAAGREAGLTVKLLAIAHLASDGRLDARVHPAFVPAQSPLADIGGGFNAVLVESSALGTSLYAGLGAGPMPTGSAVVSDIIDTCRNLLAGSAGRLPGLERGRLTDPELLRPEDRVAGWYLGLSAKDAPGVLGRVAGRLGEHDVSIASLVQRPAPAPGEAHLRIFTHHARESDVRAACRSLEALPDLTAPPRALRIEPLEALVPMP